MSEFLMPSLGADMEAGTLLEWYVKPGAAVKRGDIVALVDTSKAEIEIEIFEDGVIDELLVPEGARVPVGTALAIVRAPEPTAVGANPATVEAPTESRPSEPESTLAAAPAAAAAGAAPPLRAPVTRAAPPPPHRIRGDHRGHASPVARRAASNLGVDLAAVVGTGPDGAIRKADVERAAVASRSPVAAPIEAPPVVPAETAPVQAPRATTAGDRQALMREAIGALMARSKREIPHYYLQLEIDFSKSLDWLHADNLKRSVEDRLLPSALLLSAVARAVAEMPEMNGFWLDGAFRPATGVHLGVAISLRGGGLIAPALHDADRKSLEEIMRGVRDLVQRARAGRLRSSEMSDPTITVTNLGDRGVDLVHGVIYPPQVALVGFGAVRERAWAADGMLGVRSTVVATLAADHRAGDGHAGSRFLTLIERHLQEPEEL